MRALRQDDQPEVASHRPGAHAAQVAPAPGAAADDALVSGSERPSAGERWRAVPPERRRALADRARLLLLALSACLLVAGGLAAQAERQARREVRLEARLDVTASSSAAGGGRVDHALLLRSRGPRPLVLRGVDVAAGGLRGRATGSGLPARLLPGRELRVPLLLRVDCRVGVAGQVRADVLVRTEDGGRRRARSVVAAVPPVLGAAQTYCAVVPGTADARLSGPVVTPG